jgi:steroid delta-isomerase-like uncharacterized protein
MDTMSDANKAVACQLYQRFSEGDLSVIDDVISDDFVEHEEIPGLEPNKDGVRQMFEMFRSAFRDARFEVDGMIAEGDMLFALVRMTGTHRAEFMGVPASGRTIDVGVADYFRFENGKALEHWGVMDTGAMMQQLKGGTV